MTERTQTTLPDHQEVAILCSLSEAGGWTSGQIARGLGHYSDTRKHGAIIRSRLLEMERRGWVGRLDEKAPVAWVRTPVGTQVMRP